MHTSTKIARPARRFDIDWTPKKNESPKVKRMVDEFFQQMETHLASPDDAAEFSQAVFVRDIVSEVACRAEEQMGYRSGKMGWLAWFRKILHGEKNLLHQLQNIAKLWPPIEREIFEFYFVDGLALTDIARIAGCTSKAFHAHLVFVQCRLRKEVIKQVLHESKAIACGMAS